MLANIFRKYAEYKKRKISEEMRIAILWKDLDKVVYLLDKGVDPNGWSGDQTYLAKAVRGSTKEVVEALLTAGADPREPYYWAGEEIKLSEAARRFKLSSVLVSMLERAESESTEALGERPLKNNNICNLNKLH